MEVYDFPATASVTVYKDVNRDVGCANMDLAKPGICKVKEEKCSHFHPAKTNK